MSIVWSVGAYSRTHDATMSSAGEYIAPGKVGSLADIMRQVLGTNFFQIASILGDLNENCEGKTGLAKDDETVVLNFQSLMSLLRHSRLPVTLNIAEIMQSVMLQEDSAMDHPYLKSQLVALREAAWAELKTMLFFRMDEELRKYYEKTNLFGEGVAIKFPSASLDIEESGKCLALSRPTACVFHSMRIMEVGLKALAKELKIPYAPSWESYIRQIEANITEKHKSKSQKWKSIEPFFREILGNLILVRNYTSEEAEDVFRAVRTFMQRLSERFSQV